MTYIMKYGEVSRVVEFWDTINILYIGWVSSRSGSTVGVDEHLALHLG